MKGAIQLKMIGRKLIQNNNIICIFSRKLNYFSSTSTIKLYELVYLLSYELSITTLSLSLVRTHPNQWRIQDFPEVGAPTYNFVKFSQKLHEIERIWPREGGRGSKSLLCRSATANVSIHLEALVILISTSRDIISTT